MEENLGVITYSPVGGGLLSGKFGGEKRAQAGRLLEKI
ncbi:MAG: aldo/keto reductase, partial [bacterium]|nr:aldo/keto reductase [bacterium]